MVNDDFIRRAFLHIEQYVKILEKRKGITAKRLEEDTELLLLVAHGLQLAVQALIDIGTHILSDIRAEAWEDYADVPQLLRRHKVIPEDLVRPFVEMVRMRNVLAHEYLFLSTEIVANTINNNLDDIMMLVRDYKNYIEAKG